MALNYNTVTKESIMNIAIVNGKGGVGKTTVALGLTLCLEQAKRKVLAIDLDPQGSFTSSLARLDKSQLLKIKNPDFIVTDTPSRLYEHAPQAIENADKIIIVCKPGYGPDLETTIDTINLIERAGRLNDSFLLFNMVKRGTKAAKLIEKIDFGSVKKIPHYLYEWEEISRIHSLGVERLTGKSKKTLTDILIALL